METYQYQLEVGSYSGTLKDTSKQSFNYSRCSARLTRVSLPSPTTEVPLGRSLAAGTEALKCLPTCHRFQQAAWPLLISLRGHCLVCLKIH